MTGPGAPAAAAAWRMARAAAPTGGAPTLVSAGVFSHFGAREYCVLSCWLKASGDVMMRMALALRRTVRAPVPTVLPVVVGASRQGGPDVPLRAAGSMERGREVEDDEEEADDELGAAAFEVASDGGGAGSVCGWVVVSSLLHQGEQTLAHDVGQSVGRVVVVRRWRALELTRAAG